MCVYVFNTTPQILIDPLSPLKYAHSHTHTLSLIHSMLERGTHDELLALGGQYAKMWELQVNSGEDGEGEEKEAGVATD
jgi:hypothetical protein